MFLYSVIGFYLPLRPASLWAAHISPVLSFMMSQCFRIIRACFLDIYSLSRLCNSLSSWPQSPTPPVLHTSNPPLTALHMRVDISGLESHSIRPICRDAA
ncbi:hypothetical protein HGRIS_009678 [Hohenbuehelia grisea]|uniref:Uncharacterized protein n=1 Tax=Hohenbuehelia grisea TaxID=104357 RepID=A0ABR3J2B6_9AGAR